MRAVKARGFSLVELAIALALALIIAAIALPQIRSSTQLSSDSEVKATLNAALSSIVNSYARSADTTPTTDPTTGEVRPPAPRVDRAALRTYAPDVLVSDPGLASTWNRQVSTAVRWMAKGQYWRIGVASLAAPQPKKSGSTQSAATCWLSWRDVDPPASSAEQNTSGTILEEYFYVPDLGPSDQAKCTGDAATYASILPGSNGGLTWADPLRLSSVPAPSGSAATAMVLTYPSTTFAQSATQTIPVSGSTIAPTSPALAANVQGHFKIDSGTLPFDTATGLPVVSFSSADGSFTGPAASKFRYSSLSTSGSATCAAVLATPDVKCWGSGWAATSTFQPQPVTGLDTTQGNVKQVGVGTDSSGKAFACALFNAGTVQCWGYNSSGQLGNALTSSAYSDPAFVKSSGSTLTGVTSISVGNSYACAVVSGALACWGSASDGRLGNGSSSGRVTSAPADSSRLLANVSGVATSQSSKPTTCAWTSTGSLYCWGQLQWPSGDSERSGSDHRTRDGHLRHRRSCHGGRHWWIQQLRHPKVRSSMLGRLHHIHGKHRQAWGVRHQPVSRFGSRLTCSRIPACLRSAH